MNFGSFLRELREKRKLRQEDLAKAINAIAKFHKKKLLTTLCECGKMAPIPATPAEAMEFLVDESTKNCGVPLKQMKLKPNVLIASITHGSQTEIPNGDSMFSWGDTVVVVTNSRENIRQLNDIFA